MSYNQFNLTTLQLPVPTSSMTKAEYKNAYGIDLDNIDIRKFTLVLFGKEKYAIDQIKAIENGYEIYFNGRILSITDIIQTSDEVYDVANAKPIYFHPIYLRANINGKNIRASFIILDNTSVSYTSATFIAKIKELMDDGAIIQCNGYFVNINVCYNIYSATKTENTYFIYGNDYEGNTTRINMDSITIESVTDGVNKIN